MSDLSIIISAAGSFIAIVISIVGSVNSSRKTGEEIKSSKSDREKTKEQLEQFALDSALKIIGPLRTELDEVGRRLSEEEKKRHEIEGCFESLETAYATVNKENLTLKQLNARLTEENEKLKSAMRDLIKAIKKSIEARRKIVSGEDALKLADPDIILQEAVEEVLKKIDC